MVLAKFIIQYLNNTSTDLAEKLNKMKEYMNFLNIHFCLEGVENQAENFWNGLGVLGYTATSLADLNLENNAQYIEYRSKLNGTPFQGFKGGDYVFDSRYWRLIDYQKLRDFVKNVKNLSPEDQKFIKVYAYVFCKAQTRKHDDVLKEFTDEFNPHKIQAMIKSSILS
jgi:hypothetical protein